MPKSLGSTLQDYPRSCLTDTELGSLLGGTANSRYGKVKRMLAQGKLVHIRRGLYCLTRNLGYLKQAQALEIAQYVYGPSYISLESALSYHRLIPEAVYTTTSVTGRRSNEFETQMGIFTYQTIPLDGLYLEVERIEENGYNFFMAKPWKAICDYVYCYKKDWTSLEPLFNDLRIPPENLPDLRPEEIQRLLEYYHQKRITHFLTGVQKDLNRLQNSVLIVTES